MPTSTHLFPLSRRQVARGLVGLTVARLGMPHVARAAARNIRLGLAPPARSTAGAGAAAFAAAVAAHPALAGVLTVAILDNGSAGDDLTMLKDCSQGTLDAVVTSSLLIATQVPELGLFSIPYIFRDTATARRVLDGPLGTELRNAAAEQGVSVLAWGEQGMRHVTAKMPIRGPADLNGLKIRVPVSELVLKGFRALGASPSPLPLRLLRDALRTGEFQAEENPIGNVAALKLYEVQSHLSLTAHNFDVLGFVVSADLLDDLSEQQRRALTECASVGAVAMRKAVDDSDRDGLVQLKAAGMTVVTDVDRAALMAAVRPFQESLASNFGVERVRALLELNA